MRVLTLLQALLVTFLWSTSFVLVKWGLEDHIPPLTFAGLRYTTAFCCLLPLLWGKRASFAELTTLDWRNLLILGVLLYTVTQGANFLALSYLPAATVSLVLNLTSLVVVGMGIGMLGEFPTRTQYMGMGLFLFGVGIYFYPAQFPAQQVTGLLIASIQVFSTSASAVLGRHINRSNRIPPLVVTAISMGVGSLLLLVIGFVTQGFPAISLKGWLIIAWLAVANTAFAFTLWNHVQRSLTAMEASIINNTMLIQIAILAWVFLDESLSLQAIGGLALAAVGVLIVQLRR